MFSQFRSPKEPNSVIDKKSPAISGAFSISGTPRGIRTPNRLIRSQALYPVELLAIRISGGGLPFHPTVLVGLNLVLLI